MISLGIIGHCRLLMIKGAPILLALFIGCFRVWIPHFAVGIPDQAASYQVQFQLPGRAELMVRGLRSGLPITETLRIVAARSPGPGGSEFPRGRDKMKIGRTMDAASRKLPTGSVRPSSSSLYHPGYPARNGRQFGRDPVELADVSARRQMKLKIRAMSSESKGRHTSWDRCRSSLRPRDGGQPRLHGGLLSSINGYVAGLGGLCWMSLRVFLMAKMVSIEI